MAGNVASRLLGVVRELVIADQFGATGATSSFVAASTVPTMVYDLLIGGASDLVLGRKGFVAEVAYDAARDYLRGH